MVEGELSNGVLQQSEVIGEEIEERLGGDAEGERVHVGHRFERLVLCQSRQKSHVVAGAGVGDDLVLTPELYPPGDHHE